MSKLKDETCSHGNPYVLSRLVNDNRVNRGRRITTLLHTDQNFVVKALTQTKDVEPLALTKINNTRILSMTYI